MEVSIKRKGRGPRAIRWVDQSAREMGNIVNKWLDYEYTLKITDDMIGWGYTHLMRGEWLVDPADGSIDVFTPAELGEVWEVV